jgi:hypothetical protein
MMTLVMSQLSVISDLYVIGVYGTSQLVMTSSQRISLGGCVAWDPLKQISYAEVFVVFI